MQYLIKERNDSACISVPQNMLNIYMYSVKYKICENLVINK